MKLVVREIGPKLPLNTPGGDRVLEKTGGADQGLPWFAFLDAKGEMIVNSAKPGSGNIGHPFAPEEIKWFMTMLSKGAPKLAADDAKTIETWLRNQKK